VAALASGLTPERPVIADLTRAAASRLRSEDHRSRGGVAIRIHHVPRLPGGLHLLPSPEFWGRGLRFRSAENMIDEVRLLREKHGVVLLSVRDDTFTVSRKRVVDFVAA
jgi:hypothetical protein